MSQEPEVLYFGCRGEPGHHLHSKRSIRRSNGTPWGYHIDGTLLDGVPDNPANGVVRVARKEGWTAIAFWDRGGDTRPGSNSVFLVHADMDPLRLLELARAEWPGVFSRPGCPTLDLTPLKKLDTAVSNPVDKM